MRLCGLDCRRRKLVVGFVRPSAAHSFSSYSRPNVLLAVLGGIGTPDPAFVSR